MVKATPNSVTYLKAIGIPWENYLVFPPKKRLACQKTEFELGRPATSIFEADSEVILHSVPDGVFAFDIYDQVETDLVRRKAIQRFFSASIALYELVPCFQGWVIEAMHGASLLTNDNMRRGNKLRRGDTPGVATFAQNVYLVFEKEADAVMFACMFYSNLDLAADTLIRAFDPDALMPWDGLPKERLAKTK